MENKKMDIKQWFSTKLVPGINKLGSQRHLASLRDAFGTLIPLTIAGSLGIIMSGIVFGGSGSGYVSLLGLICKMAHPEMTWAEISNYFWADNGFNKAMLIGANVFGQLSTVTIGMTAMWFAFTLGYFLALTRNSKNPVIAGFVSLVSFLVTTMGQIAFFQGAEGLISALLFGIISTELFLWLTNVKALYIKLPDGVPPSVSKSFAVFLPFLITVGSIASLNLVFVIPNVLGAGLKVTKASFASFTGSSLEDLFKNFQATGSVEAVLGETFVGKEQIINDLQNIFSQANINEEGVVTNAAELMQLLENYYKASADQASIATMFAVMSGVDSSTISDLAANASLEFIDANGVHVLLSKYIQIQIQGAQFGWSAAIYQFFVSALLTFATGNGGLGLALAYAFFISFLWFFGVHGSNVVNGAFSPIWSMIGTINLTLIAQLGYQAAAASGEMGVFSGQFFDTFMNLGGSGATLMLIVGTLIFSKRRDVKKIATYAAPSGVFQINEPVLFGYPIVLNPIYCAPFVLSPMINVVIGWIFSPDVMGKASPTGYAQIAVPWTTPYLIAAVVVYLTPKALIPALLVSGASFAVYLPFIWLDNSIYFKKLKRDNPEAYEIEKKFFDDPRYHYQVITNNKFDRKIEKAEVIIGNAQSQNRFWDQKMPDGEKLENRKKINNAIANIKYNYALAIANEYKDLRLEKEKIYDKKWDLKNEIFSLKTECKTKLKETADKSAAATIKAEYQNKILAVKSDFIAKKPDLLVNIAELKSTLANSKKNSKQKLVTLKGETKQKILEIKSA
ncbi:PTS system cellobiose-specific IIC component [Spiroplasma clarkii]|uniref:PTS system, cellobiose-specific IIC component n=1 Tax=Spiroplasma clarkii TaxID=2139 RepID=A0A1Y0L1V4_9MOLU|nr:PTS transporter subunit EIIC [Spiroplasma clarkii]ARU91679.1 PTS system cellobiose-specific IIC component [Spiroplasma clarkii]ATX71069.1 PTS system, cellobiose-specific IIC component [Spiroplasma clarkii]